MDVGHMWLYILALSNGKSIIPTPQQRTREFPEHDWETIGHRISSLWGFLGEPVTNSLKRTILAFVFVKGKRSGVTAPHPYSESSEMS
jgi:hypothetical protein